MAKTYTIYQLSSTETLLKCLTFCVNSEQITKIKKELISRKIKF